MEDQGDVNDFLGVQILKEPVKKTFSITQTGLIEPIIKDLGFDSTSNTETTPVDDILHPDPTGAPREDLWNSGP